MKTANSEMQNLAQRIMKQKSGMDVNVYLLTEPDSQKSDSILNYLEKLIPSAETVYKMPDVALIKFDAVASVPLSIGPVPNHKGLPELFVACLNRTKDGIRTRAHVSISMTDERAQRLMEAEAHHFSREEINILVMDISKVPSGIKCWSPLIQRRFQPRINRRFGAVILFASYIESAGFSRHSCVLQNPHAYRQPPKCLLDDLAKLNQSSVQQ